jgi:hypothetical protein
VTGGLGDEAARLVGRLLQGGLHSGFGSRPEVLRHLASAAGSVAAALEALAAEAEQAQAEAPGDAPGTGESAAAEQDVRVDVQKIDVTD